MANKSFFLRACKKVEENKKSYEERAKETKQHSARLVEMQRYVDLSEEKRGLLLDLIKNGKCPDNPEESMLHRGILMFVSLLDVVDVIDKDLTNAGIKHYVITGKTSVKDRGWISKEVRENPENTVVLITLAGAESLNLNFTNLLFIYSICGTSSYQRFSQLVGRIARMSGKYYDYEHPENNAYYINYIMCDETIDPYYRILLSSRKELEEEILHADYIDLKDNIGSFDREVLKEIRKKMLWNVKHKKGNKKDA